MRFFDANLRMAILRWAAVLFLFVGAKSILAQTLQQQPVPPTVPSRVPTLPGANPNNPNEDESPMARQMAEQQAIRRNKARQKQIVDDTAKLLQLAQQLKNDMDKGKTTDLSFMKKAEEIERLAKSVKEKMREGQ